MVPGHALDAVLLEQPAAVHVQRRGPRRARGRLLGLGGMNTRGVWIGYDPKQRGSLVLDSGFDASSAEAQAFLVSACDSLKTPHAMRPGAAAPGATSCATARTPRWSARWRRFGRTSRRRRCGSSVAPVCRAFSETLRAVRRFEPRVGVLEPRRVRRERNGVRARQHGEHAGVPDDRQGCRGPCSTLQCRRFSDLNARRAGGCGERQAYGVLHVDVDEDAGGAGAEHVPGADHLFPVWRSSCCC